jgi:lipopolysaccharide transport system ATP-binding protein
MYVRLAFAVAAHLEPEILVVDEVLAVGDAEFQKKCLGKMNDVSKKEGRTVLFVSHNMAAVKSLCTKGIVLKNGTLQYQGSALESVGYYQMSGQSNSSVDFEEDLAAAPGNNNIKVLKFEVRPLTGDQISISSGIEFEIKFVNQKSGINLDVTFELKTADEIAVFHHAALLTQNNDAQTGIYVVTGKLSGSLLNAGIYNFKVIFGESQRYLLYMIDNIIQFEVLNESLGSNTNILPGIIRPAITYNSKFYAGVHQDY